MPFLPDLEKLVSSYPDEIVVAVKNMMNEVSDITNTIYTVKKSIKKHLDPLLPNFNISKTFSDKTTWDSIDETGKFIARQYFGSRTYGGIEYCVGETLRHLVRCCPRKTTKRYRLNSYGTPGFCYLCWRHTIMGSKFYYSHDPKSNNSAYRRGNRLLHLFHKELGSIYKSDKKTNAYDSFPFGIPDKLATPNNIKKWIQVNRPQMWESFNLKSINTKTNTFCATLLYKIDYPSGESHGLMRNRKTLHAEIINDPSHLAGILERCEAWLRADQIYTSGWGGARVNSGRKKLGS